jgi:CarD family transcriptional regulator
MELNMAKSTKPTKVTKKTAAKTKSAPKTAAKKPAVQSAAAKKPAPKAKPAAKKPAAKKPAAKKAAAPKAAARKKAAAPKAAAKKKAAAPKAAARKKAAAPKAAARKKAAPVVTEKVAAPAKRAPAKRQKLEFLTGDFVVYPTHGVGQVTGVETHEIANQKLKLFIISFERERMTLKVPINKVKDSGLRKLSSRKVMDTALKTLKGRVRVKRTMWSRRAQEYEAKINSGDPIFIAEVVRDLHRKEDQPDQSYSERQMYQAAMDRLSRELAAVESTDPEEGVEKLEAILAT